MHILPEIKTLLQAGFTFLETDSKGLASLLKAGEEMEGFVLAKTGDVDVIAVGDKLVRAKSATTLEEGSHIRFKVLTTDTPAIVRLLQVIEKWPQAQTAQTALNFLSTSATLTRMDTTISQLLNQAVNAITQQLDLTTPEDITTLKNLTTIIQSLSHGDKPTPETQQITASLMQQNSKENRPAIAQLIERAISILRDSILKPQQFESTLQQNVQQTAYSLATEKNQIILANLKQPLSAANQLTGNELSQQNNLAEIKKTILSHAATLNLKEIDSQKIRLISNTWVPDRSQETYQVNKNISENNIIQDNSSLLSVAALNDNPDDQKKNLIVQGLSNCYQHIIALHKHQADIRAMDIPFWIMPLWFQQDEGTGNWSTWEDETEGTDGQKSITKNMLFELKLSGLGEIKMLVKQVGHELSMKMCLEKEAVQTVKDNIMTLKERLSSLGYTLIVTDIVAYEQADIAEFSPPGIKTQFERTSGFLNIIA